MNHKFEGFDDIHADQEMKDKVLNRLENREPRRLKVVYVIFLLIALGCSIGAVAAHRDEIKEWLKQTFSSRQEPQEQVKVSAFHMETLGDEICYIDDESYLKGSCEEHKGKDSYLVYYADGRQPKELHASHMETTVEFEGQTYPVSFSYLD